MNSIPFSAASDTLAAAPLNAEALAECARQIQVWGRELGFSAVGISTVDIRHPVAAEAQAKLEARFDAWLAAGYHGEMDYMAKHGSKRTRPAELVPGTLRVISVRLDYLPAEVFTATATVAADAPATANTNATVAETTAAISRHSGDWRNAELSRLSEPGSAVVSVYARGRDYHKVLRQRLQKLAERIAEQIGPFGHRVFTDSAPVLEVELARRANLGWRGKHTLLLHPQHGSFFFLGEIYVDVALPVSTMDEEPEAQLPGEIDGAHCGSCTRCLAACPTGAIVAPYQVDARRCISYLTIELKGSIPLELRPLIGNRVYGCDDCQMVCPWNKFAQPASIDDFAPRNGLARPELVELFGWSAAQFDTRLAGSAIRRIGYERWSRNLAVGLGNALRAQLEPAARDAVLVALRARADDDSAVVREHVGWALEAA
jgi:epoxyqueuosine reductase